MIYIRLFFEFFKVGLFAIGGGLATLPFLYEIGQRTGWFNEAMISNMIAISESTPGPIGVNMATYAGFLSGNVLGGLVATIGLVTPSLIIIIIIAKMLNRFRQNQYVEAVLYGLRPAVTALIAYAGFGVLEIALFHAFDIPSNIIVNIKAVILFVILFLVMRKVKLHPVMYIAASAVIGIVFQIV